MNATLECKAIKLGTLNHKNGSQLHRAIKEMGYKVSKVAITLLQKATFFVAEEEHEVNTVIISVSDLGFMEKPTRAQVHKRGVEQGLELCPAEVGPQSLIQDSEDKEFFVAMDPIWSNDTLRAFCVGHYDNIPWLGTDKGEDHYYELTDLFAFVQPR